MTYDAQQVAVLLVLVVCGGVAAVLIGREIARGLINYFWWVKRGKRARRVNCAWCGTHPRRSGDAHCSDACAEETYIMRAMR